MTVDQETIDAEAGALYVQCAHLFVKEPKPVFFDLTQLRPYCQRVSEGIATMNIFYPEWRSMVDPIALDMASCLRCMVGQVTQLVAAKGWEAAVRSLGYAPYAEFYDRHKPMSEWTMEHGFDDNENYVSLANVWRVVLNGERANLASI